MKFTFKTDNSNLVLHIIIHLFLRLAIGPATTQWDITTCTTQGTSYTTSSSGMSASLPSPTQSSTSTTTMVNGDSGQGDLNGTSSGECFCMMSCIVMHLIL